MGLKNGSGARSLDQGLSQSLTVPHEGGFLKVSVADPRINQTALKQAHDEFPLPGFDGVMALYSIPESIVEIHPIEMIPVMLMVFGRFRGGGRFQ